MASSRYLVYCVLVAVSFTVAECNKEGDILSRWRKMVVDPNNVLRSWNSTLVNPCTWFHVTCNSDNSVTRLDLGNAGLSGPLSPEFGLLPNLQYIELYANDLSGIIPKEFGNLKNLVSLDLYENRLTGAIPATLGNLVYLRIMRLNSNKLSGEIPTQVLNLLNSGNLMILNVSDNKMAGRVYSSSPIVTTIVQDSKVPRN